MVLERSFSATRERVWEAWTRPDQLTRWFGPESMQVDEAEADLKVGGRFRIVMRSSSGGQVCVAGTYREIVAMEKLVFSWAWQSTPDNESLVTVVLRSTDAGTHLVLTHERLSNREMTLSHGEGWTSSFNKLSTLFE